MRRPKLSTRESSDWKKKNLTSVSFDRRVLVWKVRPVGAHSASLLGVKTLRHRSNYDPPFEVLPERSVIVEESPR